MARVKGEPTRYPGIVKISTARFERGYGYRARADARAAGGGQPEQSFATVGEARTWKSDVESSVAAGTYVAKSGLTVTEAVESWLDGQVAEAYTYASLPLLDRFGDRAVQSITKEQIARLVRDLHTGSGAPGGRKWAATTVNPALRVWQMIWRDLLAQRVLTHDPVALVAPVPTETATYEDDDDSDDDPDEGTGYSVGRRLTDAQVVALLDAHDPDAPLPPDATGLQRRQARGVARRGAFLHLALLGLRRGELAGLRWSAVDLDAEPPTLTVHTTRVPRRGGTKRRRQGKTAAASRTLLIPADTAEALRRHRQLQEADRTRSGSAWKGARDLAVLTIDSGAAVAPRTLDNWWHRSRDLAGLPQGVRLHDLRHTAASRLIDAQVSIRDLATWLGHADGGTLALRVYGHTDPANLRRAAEALGRPVTSADSHTVEDPDGGICGDETVRAGT